MNNLVKLNFSVTLFPRAFEIIPNKNSSIVGGFVNCNNRGHSMRISAPVQCYYCGKVGHITARLYPEWDAQQGPSTT